MIERGYTEFLGLLVDHQPVFSVTPHKVLAVRREPRLPIGTFLRNSRQCRELFFRPTSRFLTRAERRPDHQLLDGTAGPQGLGHCGVQYRPLNVKRHPTVARETWSGATIRAPP